MIRVYVLPTCSCKKYLIFLLCWYSLVLTPYWPFTCSVGKIKSETNLVGLTGGGTLWVLQGTICPFLLPEEGDVVTTTWLSVLYAWIPSWGFDWGPACLDPAKWSGSSGNGPGKSWEVLFPNTLLWVLLRRCVIWGIEFLGRRHIFWGKVDMAVHDECVELAEECNLEEFREEICNHVFGGAVSHFDPTLFNLNDDI